jgi:hypothetical protein
MNGANKFHILFNYVMEFKHLQFYFPRCVPCPQFPALFIFPHLISPPTVCLHNKDPVMLTDESYYLLIILMHHYYMSYKLTRLVTIHYIKSLVLSNSCSGDPLYKVVQIWLGLFVCKQVTVCPGHIWTTLYMHTYSTSRKGKVTVFQKS